MFLKIYAYFMEVLSYLRLGLCSRYRDLLWDGRSGDRNPVTVKFFGPIETSLGSTQPPIKWVPDLFARGKVIGVWH